MKKTLLIIALAVTGIVSTQAQEKVRFGATAGYLSGNAKVDTDLGDFSTTEGGFYLGFVADFNVSEQFNVQTELSYANIDDTSFMQLPIMAKYYVSENSGFNIQAGPQITYTLEDVADDFTKFNIGLGAGVGYDITENIFVESRYVFQLNNYYTGSADITSRINFLNFGVGYKF
ncbi:porin family protein [Aquimarina sp. 2201CG5-10]|uniref:porin family protein n=1 Tax=Aquimarina callyspongiae TaxID=3098150 RepID=UPI002AB366DA|nr:porin family protein [Aquimarina sp. 2201CG5-10]MDY8136398.1 porin family protein [Aquimarina sp. 2201CG5-10]